MVRKEPKGRGRKISNHQESKGLLAEVENSVLEDVTTTGGSAIKAVKMIKSETNCEIRVLAILDREEVERSI